VSTVGERLREARESRGLTLEQVEAQLRIRRGFLAAMEEDRFQELPAGAYARGFVRSYAKFLGLPPEDILADYQYQGGMPDPTTSIPTVLDEPLIVGSSGRSPWPMVFLTLMIVLAVAVGSLYGYAHLYLHEDPLVVLKRLGVIPTSFLDHPTSPTMPPENEDSPPIHITPGPPTGGTARQMETLAPAMPDTPAATATLQGIPTPTPRRTATPTMTPTPGPEPVEPVLVTGEVVVQANVTEPTWVSVTTDGTVIVADTLQPGSQHTWQANESISMRIGNAGGLELTVNGRPLGTLGASGEVIDRVFTREESPTP